MSNFLTNIRLNNLQREIDSIVLGGPLQNPLQTPLNLGGNPIQNATTIACNQIFTSEIASPVGAGIRIDEGVYFGDFGSVTAPNLYVGNAFANPPEAIGTVYDTVYNLPPGSTPPSIATVLTAGSVANAGQSITVPNATFTSTTVSGTLNVGTVSTTGAITAGTVSTTGVITATGSISAGAGLTTNSISENTTGAGIAIGTIATFLNQPKFESGIEVSTGDIVLWSGNVAANFFESYPPGGLMEIKDNVQLDKDLTISGLLSGTIIKGTTGSFTSIENISSEGPPSFSFGLDANNQSIANASDIQLTLPSSQDITIQANNINPSTGYPSLGLVWQHSGTNTSSIVYDTVFNVPPSVAASTLTAVLAAGNSAPTQSMIIDAVTASSTSTSIAEISGYISMPSVENPADYTTFVQATDSALQVQYGHLINIPAPGGPWGTIYDSHYNPPTVVAPVNYTNSPGVTIDLGPASNIFNQKLVTFTLNQGVGNIFTLYIENFAFQTMAPTPPDQNYVLYLDSSDMPVGNYFPNRTDKPLSYLNILDVTAAPKNYAFTQSILQTDIGESAGTVSLWVGGTANSSIPYSFVMHFISLLGTLESTNSIGTTVTIS